MLPAIAANYGKPIAFRWRCLDCGAREYDTDTKTFRAALGVDGPLFKGWDYRVGGSYASSRASSLLGGGYQYAGVFRNAQEVAFARANGVPNAVIGGVDPRAPTAPGASAPGIVGLFNAGILNPFSLTQTRQALAGLEAVSARGVALYGGKYETRQFDASVSGSLFRLPGGTAKIAAGVDYRRESYRFDGSTGNGQIPDIFNAAFDFANGLDKVNRTVKAAYGEVLFPVFKQLELSRGGPRRRLFGVRIDLQPEIHRQTAAGRMADVPRIVQHRLPRAELQPDLQRRHPIAQSGQYAGRSDHLPGERGRDRRLRGDHAGFAQRR